MTPPSFPTVDRRAFLVGGSAALLLAACGSDDDTETASSETTGAAAGDFALLAYFDPTPVFARAGIEQRLTWGLGNAAGAPVEDLPPELTFQVRFDGAPGATSPVREVVGDPIVAPLHSAGLPRGYYPMRFTPDREGTWSVQADIDGTGVEASFQVGPEGGPGVIEIGQPMPAAATATVTDPMGVDPLCTRATQCPFHDVPVADAVGTGPMVVSVSTPLYCQTAVCGPVLDLLVDASAAYPDITFVHVEPYIAPEPGNPSAGGFVPAMDELGLSYEPALFFVAADGTIVDRLDNIYDTAELTESLDALAAS